MKIFDVEQKSPEWWMLRKGIPTASQFDRIIQPKKMLPSASQEELIYELVAERMSQRAPGPADEYISEAMREGIRNEPHARRWYEAFTDLEVRKVGFCLTDCGRFGCSPDGLLYTDADSLTGAVEIKCPQMKAQTKHLLQGELPSEYKCQVHGELLVTGLPFIDFVSYCPGLETFHIRVQPDAFTAKLAECLECFWKKYVEALRKVGFKGDLP
jgi:putative phage-type endonuclease